MLWPFRAPPLHAPVRPFLLKLLPLPQPLQREVEQLLPMFPARVRMIRPKDDLLVALPAAPRPKYFLIEKAVIGRNDIVAHPVNKQHVAVELRGLPERMMPAERIEAATL